VNNSDSHYDLTHAKDMPKRGFCACFGLAQRGICANWLKKRGNQPFFEQNRPKPSHLAAQTHPRHPQGGGRGSSLFDAALPRKYAREAARSDVRPGTGGAQNGPKEKDAGPVGALGGHKGKASVTRKGHLRAMSGDAPFFSIHVRFFGRSGLGGYVDTLNSTWRVNPRVLSRLPTGKWSEAGFWSWLAP